MSRRVVIVRMGSVMATVGVVTVRGLALVMGV